MNTRYLFILCTCFSFCRCLPPLLFLPSPACTRYGTLLFYILTFFLVAIPPPPPLPPLRPLTPLAPIDPCPHLVDDVVIGLRPSGSMHRRSTKYSMPDTDDEGSVADNASDAGGAAGVNVRGSDEGFKVCVCFLRHVFMCVWRRV